MHFAGELRYGEDVLMRTLLNMRYSEVLQTCAILFKRAKNVLS